MKILVTDDSRTLRILVKRALSAAGYEVVTASNGLEALQQLRKQRHDLLILDIQMPHMDGYAVCQELMKIGEPWAQLPIILLTNVKAHALSILGAEVGTYLPKPIRVDSLLEAVARFAPPADAATNILSAST